MLLRIVLLLAPALACAQAITDYRLTPSQFKQAEALYQTRVAIYALGTLYSFALLALLVYAGIGVKFRDWAEARTGQRLGQAAIVVPLLLGWLSILTLRVSLYGHHLRLTYGLSVQGWASWWGDWLKGQLLELLLSTFLMAGFYTLLRRSPRRWWLWGWIASIPVTLVLVFVHPVFVDPLFHQVDPLATKQPQLVPEIEKVMRRGGISIERSRIWEMKASDKVTTHNAYVTGIGSSKRVVVWDTTSRDFTTPEVLAIFGHEQGHYVLNHIWLGIALSLAGLLVTLYLAFRLMEEALPKVGHRLGMRGLDDWASLPMFLLLFAVLSFVGQPIESSISRYFEHEADVYGLEVIHGLVPDSPQVAARTEQKLGEKSLSYPYPHPLIVFWTYSDPPTAERLRFAARYQPWNEGQPRRYLQ